MDCPTDAATHGTTCGAADTAIDGPALMNIVPMTEPTTRRFPAPWTVIELQDAFRIVDANGMHLAYVHFCEDPKRRDNTSRMPRDEAQWVALTMAGALNMGARLRDHAKQF